MLKSIAVLLISIWLFSCSGTKEPIDSSTPSREVLETRAIEAAIQAWRSFGLPVRCESRNLQIWYAPRDVVSKCGPMTEPMPGTRIAGCYISTGAGEATIVLPTDRDPWETADALAHEVLHFLMECAYGDPDRDHIQTPEGMCIWEIAPSCIYGEALTRI